jgi:putative redox protein
MSEQKKPAVIHYAGNEFFVAIGPSGAALTIETNSQRGAAATPTELLLMALGGCTGVDVVSILKKKRQVVTAYRVEVSGDRRDEYPRRFTRISVKHIVTGKGLVEKAVADAIHLSETKYCSVMASISPEVMVISSYEIVEADAE